jgi:WD40 repeat protein
MHTAPIKAVVTDAAGRYIITGSHDKAVRVWSTNDGRLLRTIRLPSGPDDVGQVFTVAVSPDGNTIAAGGWSKHIFLFDRATGRQVGRIGPLPDAVTNKVAFSHDGRRIAAGIGNPNGSLRLFDVDSRKEIAFDDKYKGAIYGISFDTTGRIATASFDGKLRLYDADLKLIRDARAPGRSELRPFQIAFSPDNKRLAVGYDGPSEGPPRVDVVDGQTLKAMFTPSTTGYRELLARVAWSVDGSILYAGNTASKGRDCLVFAWKDGGRGSLQVFPAASTTIADVRELSDGRIVVGTMLPSLSLFDRKGAVLWEHDAPGANFSGQAATLKVSMDGKDSVSFRPKRRQVTGRFRHWQAST